MTEIQKLQTHAKGSSDLEERTSLFAKQISAFYQGIKPKTIENNEYFKQLIRSSSSIAANYIEANESFGRLVLVPLEFHFHTLQKD